jgi:hypothetical protein
MTKSYFGTVYEYSKKFNHLCQYGSYHANADEKMSIFRQGLSLVLCEHLTLFRYCTMNELVSISIKQEDTCHARLEEERKKGPLPGPNGGAPPKYRLVYMWSPFIAIVEPPSTSAGGPTSSRLPVASCSTSSSAADWGRVSVLQLWADWALLP